MKKIISIVICAFALGIVMPQSMMAEKKEKKEKKGYVWEMPKLTGNKEFDEYLLKCDTLNTRIRSYCDAITFYQMCPVIATDNGQPDGQEIDRQWCMVDTTTNTLRSPNMAFSQNLQLILSYPAIALDMTGLAVYTASATTALPKLGLKSLSYAKYLKAGPNIVAYGGKEMKKIYKMARKQAKQIKDLKAGKVDDDYAKNAQVSAEAVDAGDASMSALISSNPIYMDKATYEKQIGEIKKQDAENPIKNDDIPEEVE